MQPPICGGWLGLCLSQVPFSHFLSLFKSPPNPYKDFSLVDLLSTSIHFQSSIQSFSSIFQNPHFAFPNYIAFSPPRTDQNLIRFCFDMFQTSLTASSSSFCCRMLWLWLAIVVLGSLSLVRCQVNSGFDQFNDSSLALPFMTQLVYGQLSNLTGDLSQEIKSQSGFCVKDP